MGSIFMWEQKTIKAGSFWSNGIVCRNENQDLISEVLEKQFCFYLSA